MMAYQSRMLRWAMVFALGLVIFVSVFLYFGMSTQVFIIGFIATLLTSLYMNFTWIKISVQQDDNVPEDLATQIKKMIFSTYPFVVCPVEIEPNANASRMKDLLQTLSALFRKSPPVRGEGLYLRDYSVNEDQSINTSYEIELFAHGTVQGQLLLRRSEGDYEPFFIRSEILDINRQMALSLAGGALAAPPVAYLVSSLYKMDRPAQLLLIYLFGLIAIGMFGQATVGWARIRAMRSRSQRLGLDRFWSYGREGGWLSLLCKKSISTEQVEKIIKQLDVLARTQDPSSRIGYLSAKQTELLLTARPIHNASKL